MVTRVARRIGAKPVSSSRITTLATKAVITNRPNRFMMPTVCRIANGELTFTLPRPPIWIWSIVTEPKVRRKKSAKPTKKSGERNW